MIKVDIVHPDLKHASINNCYQTMADAIKALSAEYRITTLAFRNLVVLANPEGSRAVLRCQ